jgi:hypothetical protein
VIPKTKTQNTSKSPQSQAGFLLIPHCHHSGAPGETQVDHLKRFMLADANNSAHISGSPVEKKIYLQALEELPIGRGVWCAKYTLAAANIWFYRNCAENPAVQGGDVERGERSSPYSGALLLDVLANDGVGCAAAAS